jgi:hypothetical protein
MKTVTKLVSETRIVASLSLEEVQPFTSTERASLLKELKDAESRIDAGAYIVYDRNDQRRRFQELYAK